MNDAEFRFSVPPGEDLVPAVVRQAGYPTLDVVGPEVLAEIRRAVRTAGERVRVQGVHRVEPLLGCRAGRLWGGSLQVGSRRWSRLADALAEPPERVGVTCTASGMMVPRKSISACMLGAREVPNRYPCVFCARSGCTYRRGAATLEEERSCRNPV